MSDVELKDELMDELRSQYERNPNDPEWMYQYGLFLLRHGELYRAREPFTRLYIYLQAKKQAAQFIPQRTFAVYEITAAYGLCDFRRADAAVEEYKGAMNQQTYEGYKLLIQKNAEDLDLYRSLDSKITGSDPDSLRSAIKSAMGTWIKLYQELIKKPDYRYYARGQIQGLLDIHTFIMNAYIQLFQTDPKKDNDMLDIHNELIALTELCLTLSKNAAHLWENLAQLYLMIGQHIDKALECLKDAREMVVYEYAAFEISCYPNPAEAEAMNKAAREHVRKRREEIDKLIEICNRK